MYNYSNKSQEVILCPSFEVERETKAMNKYIYGVVWLIAMIPICVVVLAAYHAFMSYLLEIVSSFINDYLLFVMLVPVLLGAIFSYKIVFLLNSFLASYKFQNNQIIKGIITTPVSTQRVDWTVYGAMAVVHHASHVSDIGNFRTRFTIRKAILIFKRIRDNTNPAIVRACFDTDIYKKKVYNNPRLVKITKNSLVYQCDNGKLVIPKIYAGLFPLENKKGLSLRGRIAARVAIITCVAFLLATVDLAIGYSRNDEYGSNISYAKGELADELERYGYEIWQENKKYCSFRKEVDGGEHSDIRYSFDRNGNITDVEIQLYYTTYDGNAADELSYIISTINDNFDEREVQEFVDLVEESTDGNYKYGTLKGDKYKLTLGRSRDYMDIHSY